MNQETKEKCEKLKEKNRLINELRNSLNNILFLECLIKLKDYSILSFTRTDMLRKWLINILPFSYSGHIDWDNVMYEQYSVSLLEVFKYKDYASDYYILWSDVTLPAVSCDSNSIMENADELDAVSFEYFIISSDNRLVAEVNSTGEVHIALIPD